MLLNRSFSHTAPVSALPGMSASRRIGSYQLSELAAQPQSLQNFAVAFGVCLAQILQVTPTLTDQLEQPTPRMLILRLRLQVLRQLLNPLRQQGNLHLRRASIALVTRVSLNNRIFFVFCKSPCPIIPSMSPNAPDNWRVGRINLFLIIADGVCTANAEGDACSRCGSGIVTSSASAFPAMRAWPHQSSPEHPPGLSLGSYNLQQRNFRKPEAILIGVSSMV